MDVIHQELWISGQIPVEPSDFEPQDGLMKLDATCVWPDLVEVPDDSCAINKDGLPMWLCDDELEGAERLGTSDFVDIVSTSTITISRCSSPVQGMDGDDMRSPLLCSATMWTDKLPRSEPEEFSETCTFTNPQEVEECLSPLLPDLDLKIETEIVDVAGAAQPLQNSTLCCDVGKSPVTNTTKKSQVKTNPHMELVKPCCVMLDRNEISRYLNQQSHMKTKTRNQVRNSRGMRSILKPRPTSTTTLKTPEPAISILKQSKYPKTNVKLPETSITVVKLGETPVSCVKPLRPWDPILTEAPEVTMNSPETPAPPTVITTETVPPEIPKECTDKRKSQENIESINKKLKECGKVVPKIVLQKITMPTKISSKTPEISSKTPEISSKTPEIFCKTSEISSKTPEITSKTSEISSKTPEISSKTSEISSKTPEISSKTSEISSKTPEINNTPPTEIKTVSPERLVLKIVKKGDTLQVLSPNENKTEDISPKVDKIISGNSKYADKLKILIKKHEETQKEIEKLESEVQHKKERKNSEHRVPPINNFTVQINTVDRFQCTQCDKHFARCSGVYRHLKMIHGISGIKIKGMQCSTYSCSKCTLVSFEKHEVKNHTCEKLDEDEFNIVNEQMKSLKCNKLSCYHCDEKFKTRNKLRNHVFWTHALPVVGKNNTEILSEAVCYFCKMCGKKYYSRVELQGHYDVDHNIESDVKVKPELSISLIENKKIITKIKKEIPLIENKVKDVELNDEKSVKNVTPQAFLAEFQKFVQSTTSSQVVQHFSEDEGELIETIDLTEDPCIEVTTESVNSDVDVEIIETIDLTDDNKIQISKSIKTETKPETEISLILYNEHSKMFNDQSNKKLNLIAEIGNVKVDSSIATYVQHADVLKIDRRVLVSEANFNKTIPTHFKCVLCNYSTVNNIDLQNHIQIHLAQDIINKSCLCGKICTNFDSLKAHISTKHKDNESYKSELIKLKGKQLAFRCRICNSIFTDPRLFYVHIYTQENENKYFHDCINCNLNFNNEIELKEHSLNLHQDNTPYKCKVCLSEYSDLNLLITHIKTKHIKKCIHCDICCKTITIELFEEHYHTCSKGRHRLYCPLCPNTIKSDKISLFTHINAKHNESSDINFFCQTCMNYFNTSYNYNLHVQTHKELYRCDFCSKVCTSKIILTDHIYLHFPKQVFMCSFCDVDFSSKLLFQQHFFQHHQNLMDSFVFENKKDK